jgi:hypothetical protein
LPFFACKFTMSVYMQYPFLVVGIASESYQVFYFCQHCAAKK